MKFTSIPQAIAKLTTEQKKRIQDALNWIDQYDRRMITQNQMIRSSLKMQTIWMLVRLGILTATLPKVQPNFVTQRVNLQDGIVHYYFFTFTALNVEFATRSDKAMVEG